MLFSLIFAYLYPYIYRLINWFPFYYDFDIFLRMDAKMILLVDNAIIEKSSEGWYAGQLSEIPEVISQGKTIEELKENLMDTLKLICE